MKIFRRAPQFWTAPTFVSTLLLPVSRLYASGAELRRKRAAPQKVDVPVICVGNLVVGGAGKTPVTLEIGKMLTAQGHKVFFLSRGYLGKQKTPVLANLDKHTASDIGDEALLLAAQLPTVVARSRVEGARFAVAQGAEVIVMDDGFQNPTLTKDLSLLVIDGTYGFGNGRLMPAGPLREPPTAGLKRANAVILLNPGTFNLAAYGSPEIPVILAHLLPGRNYTSLRDKRVVGFAGIGRPEKFYATLRELECDIAQMVSFPDHHLYTARDVDKLRRDAETHNAILVTTAKDFVRLPEALRAQVQVVEISVVFDDESALRTLLSKAISPASE